MRKKKYKPADNFLDLRSIVFMQMYRPDGVINYFVQIWKLLQSVSAVKLSVFVRKWTTVQSTFTTTESKSLLCKTLF